MKIIVIGAGIAGLCAAVYGRECGYEVELLEMQEHAGGLATSWPRDGYRFETCLHWLVGSSAASPFHARWQELFDVDSLRFVHTEPFVRLEPADGPPLNIFRNVDRLEEEWLAYSPEDAKAVRRFTSQIRELSRVNLFGNGSGRMGNWLGMLRNAPHLPLLHELMSTSCAEYGRRFQNPVLRRAFSGSETSGMFAIALMLSLGWMAGGDCGYPIGGSQAVIGGIVNRLMELGGKLHCGTKVVEIVVEDGTAVGVKLESGEMMRRDWVISAADGHATIFELLGERYVDRERRHIFEDYELFPSYVQVSFGVGRELSDQAGFATWLLTEPLHVDPLTDASQLSMRFFHYDPTFAPRGKTAVTCQMTSRNWAYWKGLRERAPERYASEKQRLAESVMAEMERRIPGVAAAIEVTDVSTPATVEAYTGNWQGSMEGWMPTPKTGARMLPNTLPGLRRFYMVGQWVMPGGGLPCGPLTARPVVEAICREDRVPFRAGKESRAA